MTDWLKQVVDNIAGIQAFVWQVGAVIVIAGLLVWSVYINDQRIATLVELRIENDRALIEQNVQLREGILAILDQLQENEKAVIAVLQEK
jgi:hypothetical protein